MLLLCFKSVRYRKRSQYSSQKPPCAEARAWKAYLRIFSNSCTNTFLYWPNATTAWLKTSASVSHTQPSWVYQPRYVSHCFFHQTVQFRGFLHLYLLSKKPEKKKTTQARNLKNFTNLISFLTFSCLFISVVEVTHRARTTV